MASNEEEREARFGKPLEAFIKILDTVKAELRQAQACTVPSQTREIYDKAIELLFETLSTTKPLALRKEDGGRLRVLLAGAQPGEPRPVAICLVPGGWELERRRRPAVRNASVQAGGGEWPHWTRFS
jgi:hypothetical protein